MTTKETKLTAEQELEQVKAELQAMKDAQAAAAAAEEAAKNDIKRRVKIKLIKDENKHRDPLFVNVNDYSAYIKRGVQVEVPWYVAQAIKESQDADEATAMMITEMTNELAQTEKALGLA